MASAYLRPGLTLARDANAPSELVRSLQRDLRALGYKSAGITGVFDIGTERAIRALQHDLLKPPALGDPTSQVSRYNGVGEVRVTGVTGVLDQALAHCIAAMLADTQYATLPESRDPAGDNARALAAVRSQIASRAPALYVAAIARQESGGRQYAVPHGEDEDAFVTVGLDRNNPAYPDEITSRGYGIGQYTLFHHPPTPAEMRDLINDPLGNVQSIYEQLRKKFDRCVVGPDDRADDRVAEHPLLPLRLCRYPSADARYLNDCANCARAARKVRIEPGMPVYVGARLCYEPDQYYASASASLDGVPDRADFLCDWPYAVRRYNGSGVNSFQYQARVLRNLLSSW